MLAILPLFAFLISLAIRHSLARPRHLPDRTDSAETISIVIPARDEEKNIAKLLATLREQSTQPLEIIVIDDQSSDQTAAVACELGATVIPGKEMPTGWKGKTWACQQGADAAAGEWLLFLDADLELLPKSLAKVAALTSTKATHSICPYHRVQKPYEQLSAYFNAVTLAGVDAFASTPPSQATLFGQVLLIHRDNYQTAGGHYAVRNEILENYQLAKTLQTKGVEIHHYLGKGAIEMRMFPDGLPQLIQSWKKGFLAGAAQSPKRALINTSLWLTGGMVLIGCLAAAPFLSSSFALSSLAAFLAYGALTFHTFRLAGNFSLFTALLFPVPLLFYQTLFFQSLFDQRKGRKQTWKGRTLN